MARKKPRAVRANRADSARHEEEAQALLRLIERADGFALAFVRSNKPVVTADFLDRLERELAAKGKQLLRCVLVEKVENLLDELLALPQPEGRVIAVTGIEYSIPAGEPATLIHRMNLQRSGFRQLDCPLLLFVPDFVVGLFGREAPDFWSWKTSYFDLGESEIDFLPLTRPATVDLWGYGMLDARTRLAELEYQRSLWDEADSKRKIEIALRQSVLLESLGRFSEAKRLILDRALPICEQLGDRRGRSLLLLRVVNLERALGHPKKARKLLENEILPGLEDLDPRLHWQAELGRADLLRELGSGKAARRLIQEEILPAVEAQGWQPEISMARMALVASHIDAHEFAAASGLIGQALDPILDAIQAAHLTLAYEKLKVRAAEAEGRWNVAIFRIEKYMLPILERRGEIVELAGTRAELARCLSARRLPGDRDRAVTLLGQAIATACELGLPEIDAWQATRQHLLDV